MRISFPTKVLDLLNLATSVLAKHTADGANSPLTPIINIASLDAQLAVAQTMHTRFNSLSVQAKQHTEARDIALGRHTSQTSTTAGTALFEIRKALAVVQQAHPETPNIWGSWGFDVATSPYIVWKNAAGKIVKKTTAGAIPHTVTGTVRVNIPNNVLELVVLGKNIIAKHIADGANSPLANFVDTATLSAQIQVAETENALSAQLHRDAETACANRDIALWGDTQKRTKTKPGTVAYELTHVSKLLTALFINNMNRLGDWGFTVNAPATHTTPPPTPPTGGGNNNPSNPL